MKKTLSIEKRIRQATKAYESNKQYLTKMKTAIKKVESVTTKSAAEPLFKEAVQIIDQLASKGIIHTNNAANKKARLAAIIKKLG